MYFPLALLPLKLVFLNLCSLCIKSMHTWIVSIMGIHVCDMYLTSYSFSTSHSISRRLCYPLPDLINDLMRCRIFGASCYWKKHCGVLQHHEWPFCFVFLSCLSVLSFLWKGGHRFCILFKTRETSRSFPFKLPFYLLWVSLQLSYPGLLVHGLDLELSQDQP